MSSAHLSGGARPECPSTQPSHRTTFFVGLLGVLAGFGLGLVWWCPGLNQGLCVAGK